MKHATAHVAILVAILAAIGAPAAASDLELTTEIIAITGEPAWDDPTGVFDRFWLPVINQSSTVGTRAFVDFEGTVLEGLYLWEGGVGQRLTQEGEPFGQHPTYVYSKFSHIRIDESGQIAYFGDFPSGQTSGAIFIGYPGDFRIMALTGPDDNPDPDYLQGTGGFNPPLLTRSGRLAFEWEREDDCELWGGDADGIQLLATSPIQAPGYREGVIIDEYLHSSANEAGTMSVRAELNGDVEGAAMLFADPDTIEIPVGPGITPPGLDVSIGAVVHFPSMNGRGDIAFIATFSPVNDGANSAANGPPRKGIFVGPPDALILIAQVGQVPPGYSEEFTITSFAANPFVSADGKVIMAAGITDGEFAGVAVWLWNGEGFEFLFQRWDEIVNVPDTTFYDFGASGQSAVNAHGRFAFIGLLDIPGPGFEDGLVVTDQCGHLHAIAVVGDTIEVATGDFRVIEHVNVHHRGIGSSTIFPLSGDDGAGTFLNDADELVYVLLFEDDSQVMYLTTIADVAKGDLDDDCTIGPADLAIMLGTWGPCPDKGDCPADLNGDGVVGPPDLAILLGNWS